MASDATKSALGLEDPDRDPVHDHAAVSPALDVAREATEQAVQVLDRVRAAQRPVEGARDAEPLQGQRLLEPLAQRRGSAGMRVLQRLGILK